MRYEPVGYIYEYEVCALLFLAVIMLRYFFARRFPNQKNRLFSLIMCCTALDMVLDVVSSVIIDNVFRIPVSVTFIVNTAFYMMQIAMALFMMVYTFAMVEYLDRKKIRRLFPLFLPALAMAGMLLTNPFTQWFFYVDPERGYVHGTMFGLTYIACFFYMAVTLLCTLRNRKKLRKNEYTTVCVFLAVVLVSIVVQYLFPAMLVSGVAMAFAVILMYFTIQNPDTMLDAATGAFTYDAMLSFLHDRMQEHSAVQMVAVKIHNMHRINILLGVENGSGLLMRICRFLQGKSGNIWVFRMRGSCFVAITQKYDDYRALSELTEQRLKQPWEMSGVDVVVQATVCCVATDDLPASSVTPEETVNYIDTAFLQNEWGSDMVKRITVGAEFLDKLRRYRAVEAALRDALAEGKWLELYFQPLWSAKEKRFSSAEVLLRFHHPTMGNIQPDEFVPIAESNGMISALDELVLRKTCQFIRKYAPRANLGLDTLEVNLSALEFMHRRLPDLLNNIFTGYEVDPHFLILEITETAATDSFELLLGCMQEICKNGCRFALDDFGTGYANISQVLQLPFSMVKLDRSMLFGREVVLESVTRMFNAMGLVTVAEGVENAQQAALTNTIQTDYIQGYYYARPMSEEKFVAFMKDKTEPEPDKAEIG